MEAEDSAEEGIEEEEVVHPLPQENMQATKILSWFSRLGHVCYHA